MTELALSTGIIQALLLATNLERLGHEEELIAGLTVARIAYDGLVSVFDFLRIDADVRFRTASNLERILDVRLVSLSLSPPVYLAEVETLARYELLWIDIVEKPFEWLALQSIANLDSFGHVTIVTLKCRRRQCP